MHAPQKRSRWFSQTKTLYFTCSIPTQDKLLVNNVLHYPMIHSYYVHELD